MMAIETKEAWQKILDQGAEILWETKLFKVFRLNGEQWRAMPAWRRAWPFEIIER